MREDLEALFPSEELAIAVADADVGRLPNAARKRRLWLYFHRHDEARWRDEAVTARVLHDARRYFAVERMYFATFDAAVRPDAYREMVEKYIVFLFPELEDPDLRVWLPEPYTFNGRLNLASLADLVAALARKVLGIEGPDAVKHPGDEMIPPDMPALLQLSPVGELLAKVAVLRTFIASDKLAEVLSR